MEAQAALCVIISSLVLVSNSIVIIVIVKSRELHLPTLWNIAFMAAWDFSYGLYYLVFMVPSWILGEFFYSEVFAIPASILFMLLTGQSFFNILVALVDRYISVRWPLHYPRLMSGKRYIIAILSVTCINICAVCVTFSDTKVIFNKDYGIVLPVQSTIAKVLSSAIASTNVIIIFFLFVQICLTLGTKKEHTTWSRSSRCCDPGTSKFKVTMILSAFALIVCYLPLVLGYIFNFTMTETFLSSFMQVSFIVILSNSLWNIVIYAATYKPFKDAFLRLFCPSLFRKRRRREFQADMKYEIHIVSVN